MGKARGDERLAAKGAVVVTDMFRDEQGFTTLGVAVAMLLALALLFASAHIYELNSCTAEIQEVADASALAASSVVAEFTIAVALCDAVVLSLTLAGVLSGGAGAVALCVPGAQAAGAKLLEGSNRVFSARNDFARSVASGLNRLQEALPFLCALNAAAVASANNGAENRYVAVAVPVPLEGEPITVGAAAACEELEASLQQNADQLSQQAAAAEEAARRANEAKARGYQADCGANPEYCMYQRAQTLAALPSALNPLYRSPDTWSFSVALERARSYYQRRAVTEAAADSTLEEQCNAALRRVFYGYAVQELRQGYVDEREGSFSAHFPLLFSKTAELRESSLYREPLFPITDNGGQSVMHAFDGCPQAAGWTRLGSAEELDGGGFVPCTACEFRLSDLGDVASPTSRIPNGFEYHYRLVAQAAKDYEQARQQMDPASEEAKSTFSQLLDRLSEALSEAASFRISSDPPGSQGCVAIVVNLANGPVGSNFVNAFAPSETQLGLRVAVAGAQLEEDPAKDGATVISSLLDGVQTEGVLAAGDAALNCWSALLSAYGTGQASLLSGVEAALNGVPLVGASGLGSWARGKLEAALSAVGLQPAQLAALKPVLANTAQVTSGDSGAFSVSFRRLQQGALLGSSPTGSLLDGALQALERQSFEALDRAEGGVQVASFTLPVVGVEVPITIALPPSATAAARNWIDSALAAVGSLAGGGGRGEVWQ